MGNAVQSVANRSGCGCGARGRQCAARVPGEEPSARTPSSAIDTPASVGGAGRAVAACHWAHALGRVRTKGVQRASPTAGGPAAQRGSAPAGDGVHKSRHGLREAI